MHIGPFGHMQIVKAKYKQAGDSKHTQMGPITHGPKFMQYVHSYAARQWIIFEDTSAVRVLVFVLTLPTFQFAPVFVVIFVMSFAALRAVTDDTHPSSRPESPPMACLAALLPVHPVSILTCLTNFLSCNSSILVAFCSAEQNGECAM